jgi:hypothetical protein
MLINERNIKKRHTKPSYLLYTTINTNVIKQYTILSTEEYVDIINKNNINNIEKILTKKLESVSVSNIFRLIDYTNLLKMDLENKIKNNKNNHIFVGLSLLVILFFSLLYSLTFYDIQKYFPILNQNISLINNQIIKHPHTVPTRRRFYNKSRINKNASFIINQNASIINENVSFIINQNASIINQNASSIINQNVSIINQNASSIINQNVSSIINQNVSSIINENTINSNILLITIQNYLFNKITIRILIFLISTVLILKINNMYPPVFIQKNKLNKYHKTTKILQKIIDVTY